MVDHDDSPCGPVSDRLGRNLAGSEAATAQLSDEQGVENAHHSGEENEIGPVGPVISEGETLEESIDDAGFERRNRKAIMNEPDFDDDNPSPKAAWDL